MKFNIITCTYNRKDELSRLKDSLCKLTINKDISIDVTWWISDDGSVDDTEMLVRGWSVVPQINFIYIKNQQNRGRHFALFDALEKIDSGYVIILDSDDLPKTDIIQTFYENIKLYPDKVEYRARCVNQNGKYLSDNTWLEKQTHEFQTSWHELVLKNKFDEESISCFRSDYIKQVVGSFDNTIYKDDIRWFNESIFWARNRKPNDMLFINKPLRIYFVDQEDSIQNKGNIIRHYKEDVVYSKYFIQENFKYFFWRPNYFLSIIIKGMVARFIIEKNWIKSITLYDVRFTKLIGSIFFPFAFLYYTKAKLTNNFWRN